MKFPKLLLLVAILISSLTYTSCNKDNSTHQKNEFDVIDEVMTEWYFWNDELPPIESSNYNSANAYFEDLLVSIDRWSFIANRDQLLAFLANGTYTGYGLAFKFDNNNDVRVKLIFAESPLASEGITRGWKLTTINNVQTSNLSENEILAELDKPSSDFIFENDLGEQKEISANQITLDQNSVLKRIVINHQGVKVAYLAFDSFLEKSEDELNEAFSYFREQNAEELVLDLRYNGGGSTAIANQLSSLITGNAFAGEIYSQVYHNESKMGEDFTEAFQEQTAAYAFDRVFIITTSATASASEMVINGLKPYMDQIILIGSTTHGKPVGMYVFEDESLNLAIVPISFTITNADDEGNYFEGIPVDYQITDDLSHDFGNIAESNFKAALDYIATNNFPARTREKSLATNKRTFNKKGFDELIDAN